MNDLWVLGVFYGVSSLDATHCPYGWMDAFVVQLCEQSLLYSDGSPSWSTEHVLLDSCSSMHSIAIRVSP